MSIVTLTAPSGGGKTTLMKRLLKELPGAKRLPSHTTRDPRPNDPPGEYVCVSKEEFERLEREGAFAWTTPPFLSERYGTRQEDFRRALISKDFYFAAIVPDMIPTIHEFASILGFASNVRSIYMLSPSRDALFRRLTVDRGESEASALEKIEKCASWDQQARETRVHGVSPYLFVQDNDELELKYEQVLQHVRHPWN